MMNFSKQSNINKQNKTNRKLGKRTSALIQEIDNIVASQCVSDDVWQSMLVEYAKLRQRYTEKEIILASIPVEQIGFGINVNHTIKETDLTAIRDLINDAQKDFFANMTDSITHCAKNVSVVFATFATVSLLSQTAFGFARNIICSLLNMIYSWLFGKEEPKIIVKYAVEQGGHLNSLELPALPALLLKFFFPVPTTIYESITSNPSTDQLMRKLGYLGDIKIEKGSEKVMESIQYMIDYLTQVILVATGFDVRQKIGMDVHVTADWLRRCESFLKQDAFCVLEHTDLNHNMLKALHREGQRFKRNELLKSRFHIIDATLIKLGNLLSKFEKKKASRGMRDPPVSIYLFGDTGCGKSSLSYPLAADILNEISTDKDNLNLEEDYEKLIYMRCPEQEYWDGYIGQMVTIFDDFSQLSDSKANPNVELFEIIRTSNCFPYPLHMAKLEDKDNTEFTSKIVIASSNMKKPQCESLNFAEALFRRFDFAIEVKRQKRTFSSGEFTMDDYSFQLYNMENGQIIQDLTYDQLILMCGERYFQRSTYTESIKKHILTNYRLRKVKASKCAPDEVDLPIEQSGVLDAEAHIGFLKKNGTQLSDWIQQQFQFTREKLRLAKESYDETFKRVMALEDELKDTQDGIKNISTLEEYYRDIKNMTFPDYIEAVEMHVKTLNELWQGFVEEHPWVKYVQYATMALVTSFALLKMFLKFKRTTKSLDLESNYTVKNVPQGLIYKPTTEAYTPTLPKVVRQESYNLPKPVLARPEAYTPTKVSIAKQENYTPIVPKLARQENNSIEINIANEQGIKDLNATEIMTSVTKNNLYKMYVEGTNDCIGHIIFLKGQIALMPRHYLNTFNLILESDLKYNNITQVYCNSPILNRSFHIRVKDIVENMVTYESPNEDGIPVYSRDLMAIKIPTAICHKNITEWFARRVDLSYVMESSVMLPTITSNNMKKSNASVVLLRFSEGHSKIKTCTSLDIFDNNQQHVRTVRDAWEYNMDTVRSECGAPLIVRNTQVPRGKIVGIHIAGIEGTGKGFSTPVYKEDVLEILKFFPDEPEQIFTLKLEEFPTEQSQIPRDSEFIRLGKLKKPLAQPSKSKIEPSLVHALYKQPETKPCLLREAVVNGETFNPRTYRIERLGNIPVCQNLELIGNAKKALIDELSSQIIQSLDVIPPSVKAEYTFAEACEGIDGDLYVNSIKRTTSPGFPYVQKDGFKTRKEIFGEGEKIDISTPKARYVESQVNRIVEGAESGKIYDNYFIDSLKDERKPLHKAHKTRLFAAGPLDYLIASKMFFNGPVALLQRTRNDCHVSVGTNPYSNDWDRIVKLLQRKSKNMIAGDFEGFDASQHQCLLEAAGEVLIELSKRHLNADQRQCKIMKNLLVSLFNSLHISGDEVYQWTHSLPSGHYLTAIINSIFVNLAFGCVWQLAHENVSYVTARSFWRRCGIVAYGDDHVVSVPQQELEFFNQITLPGLFRKIGLSYTMEDKDAVATDRARDISAVSYLKRGFLFDEQLNRWIAPLSLDTILEMPQWIHKSPDPKLQTIANLEYALKELSCHRLAMWERWAPKLVGACEKLGHYTEFRNKNETKAICLDQDYVL